MTTEYRRSEVISGSFVLLSVIVFTVFAFRVEGLDMFAFARGERVACRALFDDVKTLEPGAKVAAAGRRVGRVTAVRLVAIGQTREQVAELRAADPTGFADLQEGDMRQMVEVEFVVDDAQLRVDRATASVELGQDGVLGRHFLVLEPGYWRADRMPEPVVEAAYSEPLTFSVREVDGVDEVMQAMRTMADEAAALLDRVQSDVLSDDNVRAAKRTMGDLSAAVGDLRLLLSRDDPDGMYGQVIRPMHAVLQRADAVLDANGPRLQRVLDELERATQQLTPKADRLLDNLAAASDGLGGRLQRLDGEVSAALTSTTRLIDENRADIAETTRRLRRAMWQAEMALRKIRADPSLLLFGDAEPELEAGTVDHSALDRSGRARPFGQRDEGEGR